MINKTKGRKILFIISLIIIICALFYLIAFKMFILVQVGEEGCIYNFKKYSPVKDYICNFRTNDHCIESYDFAKLTAESKMIRCMCDKYLDNPSLELGEQISKQCHQTLSYLQEECDLTNIDLLCKRDNLFIPGID